MNLFEILTTDRKLINVKSSKSIEETAEVLATKHKEIAYSYTELETDETDEIHYTIK